MKMIIEGYTVKFGSDSKGKTWAEILNKTGETVASDGHDNYEAARWWACKFINSHKAKTT